MRGTRSVGVVLVLVALVAMLASGCGKQKSTKNTTAPVVNTAPSTTPQSQVVPQEQQVIYDYYSAINDKRYQDAYNRTSDDFKSHYTSFSEFEASYRQYVSSVKVVSLTRLDQFSALAYGKPRRGARSRRALAGGSSCLGSTEKSSSIFSRGRSPR